MRKGNAAFRAELATIPIVTCTFRAAHLALASTDFNFACTCDPMQATELNDGTIVNANLIDISLNSALAFSRRGVQAFNEPVIVGGESRRCRCDLSPDTAPLSICIDPESRSALKVTL